MGCVTKKGDVGGVCEVGTVRSGQHHTLQQQHSAGLDSTVVVMSMHSPVFDPHVTTHLTHTRELHLLNYLFYILCTEECDD